jgi:hypothetical protein
MEMFKTIENSILITQTFPSEELVHVAIMYCVAYETNESKKR